MGNMIDDGQTQFALGEYAKANGQSVIDAVIANAYVRGAGKATTEASGRLSA